MQLKITLLGAPYITLNGRSLHFPSIKATALLAYLVTTERLHDRAELAALFWPESDTKRARGALRYTLSVIKKEQLGEFLIVNRQQIGINSEASWEADVGQMRCLFAAVLPSNEPKPNDVAQLEKGVALYQAEFLAGFSLEDCPDFNDWAYQQRELLQREFTAALKRLVTIYHERQQWDVAITYAHRWLNLNPLHEPAHCQLMTLYAAASEWTAVENQYHSLSDLLTSELGSHPQPETVSLYKALMSQRAQPVVTSQLTPDQRSRYVLIEKVKRFWVRGFLQPLRDEHRYITLKFNTVNQMIDHPWSDILDSDPQPTVVDIYDAFYQANQALLILGAPGSGKTISLIGLAEQLLRKAEVTLTQAVPVILNLSSWASEKAAIADWAVEELVAKYQIPRRIGRRWLKEDRLLFLLDGLDEMDQDDCFACIKAINDYRQLHGLADVVVCCRDGVYESAVVLLENNRLQLNGAVHIRPLTTTQIDQSLPPELVSTFLNDEELLEMAQSPLNLHMIQVAFAQNYYPPSTPTPLNNITLFAHYVDRMIQRQAQKGAPLVEKAKLTNHLSWLAQQMKQHNQAIFLIEQLQPSWLAHSGWLWLYLFSAHAILPALFGVPIMWSFIELIGFNPPYIQLNFFIELSGFFGWQRSVVNDLLILFGLNFLGSLLSTVMTGLFFTWQRKRSAGSLNRFWEWGESGVTALIAWLAISIPLMQTDDPSLAVFLGSIVAIGFVLTSGNFEYRKSFQSDIRIRGVLKWSWRNASRFALIGAGLSMIWSGIIWLRDPAATAFILNALNMGFLFFLIGGLTDKLVGKNTRPNEGMYIAGFNGLKALLITATPSLILTALTVNWFSGVYTGIMIGVFAGTIHGFNDVAKHFILRLLLRFRQGVPSNYVSLLDYATDCVLLQKIGGGYTFRHRLLQEYFVEEYCHQHSEIEA